MHVQTSAPSPSSLSLLQRQKTIEQKQEQDFRRCFKPIGQSYVHALTVKKLKSADGTAITTATCTAIGQSDGIADEHIRKDDTIIVPISQFSFTPKQIRDKFGGDVNFLLRGIVTRVMKTEINIKFDGDQHVSPYPKDGFGQFVKRRQKKATTTAYYDEILIEEWNLNIITNNGWMEGDCLNFAFSEFFLDQRLPSVSASVYLLQSGGNIELQVSIV